MKLHAGDGLTFIAAVLGAKSPVPGAQPLQLMWKRVVLSSHSYLIDAPVFGQPFEAGL